MNLKTFFNYFTLAIGLCLFGVAGPVVTKCYAQTLEPAFVVDYDENGDSSCYIMVGDFKEAIDCAERAAWLLANQPPAVVDTVPADDIAEEVQPKETKTLIDQLKSAWTWIVSNWYIVILPLLEIVVRLIPGEKDNNLLRLLQSWLDQIIPNKKKGGGRFVAFEKEEDAPRLGVIGKKRMTNEEH